jgi:hypothetical protein
MRNAAIIVCCVLLFGCSTRQHWMKVDATGKIAPVQNPDDLRKSLGACAAWRGGDLSTLFGSQSEFTAFQKCMHDSGYAEQ